MKFGEMPAIEFECISWVEALSHQLHQYHPSPCLRPCPYLGLFVKCLRIQWVYEWSVERTAELRTAGLEHFGAVAAVGFVVGPLAELGLRYLQRLRLGYQAKVADWRQIAPDLSAHVLLRSVARDRGESAT